MPDLSAKIRHLRLDPALMNGSGVLSFAPVLKRYAEMRLGAIVTKSVCSEVRTGFENPIFVQSSGDSWINAVGLPGGGHLEKRKELDEYYDFFRAKDKPVIASIFDGREEKLIEVAQHLEPVCDAFEINLSCPNLMPGERFGIEVGRDPALVRSFVQSVVDSVEKPVLAKLSPGPYINNRNVFKEIVIACAESGCSGITAINTVSGGMKIDIRAKRPVLAAKYGGVSGKAIKPIGIGCVYTAYKALKENGHDIPIIAVGGIETAEDAIEYALAGASAFQIATYFVDKSLEQTRIYLEGMCDDMEKILNDVGANGLQEIVGGAHE